MIPLAESSPSTCTPSTPSMSDGLTYVYLPVELLYSGRTPILRIPMWSMIHRLEHKSEDWAPENSKTLPVVAVGRDGTR
jgi:hypothetical protein